MSPVTFTESSTCPTHHEGKMILSDQVPLSLNQIFNFLFHDSEFCKKAMETLDYTDIYMGEWLQNENTGLQTRTNRFVVPVTGLGAKSCHITESQELKVSSPGKLYMVEITTHNSGVPYGDSFYVFTHVCIARNSTGDSHLNVYCQVMFTQSVLSFIKRMIERGVWEGVQTYYAMVEEMLRDECIKIQGIQSLRRFTTTLVSFSQIRRRQKRRRLVFIVIVVLVLIIGNVCFWCVPWW